MKLKFYIKKKSHFSKVQIKEFSLLFIMLNYLDTASLKVEEISKLIFSSNETEDLKNFIIDCISDNNDKETIKSKASMNYQKN